MSLTIYKGETNWPVLQSLTETKHLSGLGGDVAVNLDAENSIENIRTSLKEGIELDISAKSGASGILESIKGFVEEIKIAVEKIEPKLPVAALAA